MFRILNNSLVVAILLLLTGCDLLTRQGLFFDQVEPSGVVKFEYESSTVVTTVLPGAGGSTTVSFSASGDWVARISDNTVNWCTLSPESGSADDKTLTISILANDKFAERKCVVSLFCDGRSATIIVKQAEKEELSLSESKVEIPAEGGNFYITVSHTSDFSFKVSENAASWIRPLTTKAPAEDKLGFEVLLNPESTPREGSVSFTSQVGEETVRVIQKGILDCIIVSQKEYTIEQEGGTFTVKVKSNVDYDCTITEGASWISPVNTKALVTDSERSFSVSANPKDELREGKIVFSNNDLGLRETVTVKQKPVLVFSLSPDKVELDYQGGNFEIKVTSSVDYDIKTVPDWISVISTRTQTNTHIFNARTNTTDEPRSGNIIFTNSEGGSLTVAVTQKAREIAVDWSKAFMHHSLIMRFTATWCGYCPIMQRSVLLAQQQYPDKLIHVALHGGGSDLEFRDEPTLQNQYKVTGFPTGIVDGRIKIHNQEEALTAGKIIDAAKQTEQKYGTKTGVSLNSTLSGRDLDIDLTVYAKKKGSYKITVLLLEDGIQNAQSGVAGGLFTHNDVARISVTNVAGDTFDIAKDCSYKDFTYSVKSISSSFRLANMKILVVVWTTFNSSSISQSEDYGNYYVDNCITVPLEQAYTLMTTDSGVSQ